MLDDTTASVTELARAHGEGLVSVPPDLAAYVLLCLAEQLREDLHFVDGILSVEGTVAAITSARPKNAPSPVATLSGILRDFLAAASSPAVTLQTLSYAPATTPLAGWSDALSKALMPLNRDASKRALGRMVRELKRRRSTHGLRAIGLGDGTVPERLSLTPPPPDVALVSSDHSHTPRDIDAAAPVSTRLRALLGEYDDAPLEEATQSLRTMAGVDAAAPVSAALAPSMVLERVATGRAHTVAKWIAALLLLAFGLAWALWPSGGPALKT